MAIEPYLFFNGHCEEAIEFYKNALGAEVLMLMRYKESPEPPPPGMVPAGWDNKVMHASLRVGNANLMASDGCSDGVNFQGFSLSLTATDEADARRKFIALAEGGQVRMPLTKTFWSPCFGMVADRFGVGWMVTVAPQLAR
ncbi:MAG TPA: VOC family protein [Candidatus Binatia bacterium]|nr:VOC family protein [Candidatus Binatia bacterium]